VATCYAPTSREFLERAAPTLAGWKIAIFPPEYLIDPTTWNRLSQKFNNYEIAPTYGSQEVLEASLE
jgi:hypothetical protein